MKNLKRWSIVIFLVLFLVWFCAREAEAEKKEIEEKMEAIKADFEEDKPYVHIIFKKISEQYVLNLANNAGYDLVGYQIRPDKRVNFIFKKRGQNDKNWCTCGA